MSALVSFKGQLVDVYEVLSWVVNDVLNEKQLSLPVPDTVLTLRNFYDIVEETQ